MLNILNKARFTLTCLFIGKYDMISKETRKLVLAKYKGLKYD